MSVIDWSARMIVAQWETTYLIKGSVMPRVPYGHEGDAEGIVMADHCRDCGVVHGQLHVPGCVLERCPGCGGQAVSCSCGREVVDRSPITDSCRCCPGGHGDGICSYHVNKVRRFKQRQAHLARQ